MVLCNAFGNITYTCVVGVCVQSVSLTLPFTWFTSYLLPSLQCCVDCWCRCMPLLQQSRAFPTNISQKAHGWLLCCFWLYCLAATTTDNEPEKTSLLSTVYSSRKLAAYVVCAVFDCPRGCPVYPNVCLSVCLSLRGNTWDPKCIQKSPYSAEDKFFSQSCFAVIIACSCQTKSTSNKQPKRLKVCIFTVSMDFWVFFSWRWGFLCASTLTQNTSSCIHLIYIILSKSNFIEIRREERNSNILFHNSGIVSVYFINWTIR